MTVVYRDDAQAGHAALQTPGTRVSRTPVVVALAFTAVGVAVAAVLTTFLVVHAHHGVARFAARVIPVPAAVVDPSTSLGTGSRIVWYREVVERANALEALSDVPVNESMARALMLAERSAIVDALADELHPRTLPLAEGESEGERSADFAALTTIAGWTQRDAQRYAVDVYARDIAVEEAAFDDASLQAMARARMESIQLKLQQGIAFADLAAEYGEGDAVLTDGDIGYVDPESLPEELRTVAKTIAVDEVSSIVQTHRAFWIVKAEDVIENDDGTRSVWLRVIEVKKDVLGDIVDERMKTVRVREFLR